MNYLLKECRFTNDKAEILIDQAVQTNIITSVLFSVKTFYRVVKSNSVGDTSILVPDNQVDTRRG